MLSFFNRFIAKSYLAVPKNQQEIFNVIILRHILLFKENIFNFAVSKQYN